MRHSVWARLSASGAALLGLAMAGCHGEPQAVTQVATKASAAEHRAQAESAVLEAQRSQLARIPVPTKGKYVDVHDPAQWANPFISVDAQMITLRVMMADANPSAYGQGGMLRPAAARRQELQIRRQNLAEALIALPAGAWPYGRVVAIEESPLADKKLRPEIRRQIEVAIQELNSLGVVVDEWPAR